MACPAATWPRMIAEITNPAPTATMPIGAPRPGVRFPRNRIRKNAAAGSDGISQANGIMAPAPWTPARRSPLQQVHFVDVDRFAVPVDEDDDGQADPHFRCSDSDHEQGED